MRNVYIGPGRVLMDYDRKQPVNCPIGTDRKCNSDCAAFSVLDLNDPISKGSHAACGMAARYTTGLMVKGPEEDEKT
jgi:hypothetical protein